MKNLQALNRFSDNTLAKVFLSLNLIVFALVFDWNELFIYLSKTAGECKPFVPMKLSFGIYDISPPSFLDYILAAAAVVFSVFYLPAYLATIAVIGAIKNDYPQWCHETFDLISLPIFSVINCVYLIFLSYFVERIHEYCRRNTLLRKNPLSIFSK